MNNLLSSLTINEEVAALKPKVIDQFSQWAIEGAQRALTDSQNPLRLPPNLAMISAIFSSAGSAKGSCSAVAGIVPLRLDIRTKIEHFGDIESMGSGARPAALAGTLK
ncbi:hypothetical protein [Methylocapsa aurea]|uniref:hypothetical protein n=1 Tax=Methylocapsa aurea TaxID=663610 RepID=UPI0012EC82C0|nr:hypothetical protein [Methylocapsa aurea]